MSKTSYKVPVSLDRSFLDHELNGPAGTSFPIKVPLFFIVSVLILFWAATSTFIASADWWVIALFVVWWLATSLFLGMFSKTKEFRFKQIPALLAYVPPAARRVLTRSNSMSSQFKQIVGVKSIEEDGLIRFSNGAVGQAYLVVGSASVLLFDEDRNDIINRVDNFWRKVDTSTDYITITTKEPQRVYRQVANLKRRYDRLELEDEDLRDILEKQYTLLNDHVGKQFKSIHQYMILRSDGMESLRTAHNLLMAEIGESTLMFKEITKLDRKGTEDMQRVFYQGRD